MKDMITMDMTMVTIVVTSTKNKYILKYPDQFLKCVIGIALGRSSLF